MKISMLKVVLLAAIIAGANAVIMGDEQFSSSVNGSLYVFADQVCPIHVHSLVFSHQGRYP